jgi:hypothetical protein
MKLSEILIGIMLIALAILIMFVIQSSYENNIRDWAQKRGQTVEVLETNVTPIGSPFYYVNNGQYIYKVKLSPSGEIWWVRTGLWFDYEKE